MYIYIYIYIYIFSSFSIYSLILWHTVKFPEYYQMFLGVRKTVVRTIDSQSGVQFRTTIDRRMNNQS